MFLNLSLYATNILRAIGNLVVRYDVTVNQDNDINYDRTSY